MISVLLNIFDSRASLLSLIKLMIEREVAQTGTLSSLKKVSFLTLTQIPRRACSEGIQRACDSSQPLQNFMAIITWEVWFSLFSTPWSACRLERHTKLILRKQWVKTLLRIKRILKSWPRTSFRSSRHRFLPFQGEKIFLVKMTWTQRPWWLAGCSARFVPISRMLCRSKKSPQRQRIFITSSFFAARVYGRKLNLPRWALSYSYGTDFSSILFVRPLNNL